jgi:hypothetical protein
MLGLLLLGSVALSSCDGSGDGGAVTDAELPLCQPNTFRITGTIDNMSIDITEAGGGGFAQDDHGGELDVGDPLAGNASVMKLTWTKGLLDGQTGAAAGTVTLASGAFAGQTLCAGAGSIVHMPEDHSRATVQFRLEGVSSGATCTTQHTGTLQGCVN